MFNRHVGLRSLVLLAGASFLSTITWANSFEVSGLGGGITVDDGGGTHPLFGGAAAFGLGDNFHLFGEFSYIPLPSSSGSATLSSGATVTGSQSAKLADFGGGLDYSFLSSQSKLRPYVVGAFGLAHTFDTLSLSANGTSASVSMGSNGFYAGAGGGVRLYVGKRWGLKPEVRYQRYQSTQGGGSNTVMYTVGVFYRFGE
jgi:hypothetical protein